MNTDPMRLITREDIAKILTYLHNGGAFNLTNRDGAANAWHLILTEALGDIHHHELRPAINDMLQTWAEQGRYQLDAMRLANAIRDRRRARLKAAGPQALLPPPDLPNRDYQAWLRATSHAIATTPPGTPLPALTAA